MDTSACEGNGHLSPAACRMVAEFFSVYANPTRISILCALREGPSGVEGINRLAQTHLRRLRNMGPEVQLYAGMPLLITRNDYGLGLFNGDSGVLWP
ncbi:MAG TPA: hypothetical protein PKV69_09495, partial [Candidatus Hydrogenedentes bacterium]|nr:hypothetical protein [Candidatus Hydrogenedentota bacterium]